MYPVTSGKVSNPAGCDAGGGEEGLLKPERTVQLRPVVAVLSRRQHKGSDSLGLRERVEPTQTRPCD